MSKEINIYCLYEAHYSLRPKVIASFESAFLSSSKKYFLSAKFSTNAI